MSLKEKALEFHKKNKGKISIVSKIPLDDKDDLTLAYTPGVAEPSMEIFRNKDKVYDYTSKGNMVAIVTDGSAVLGLGNIGPEASLPVMEGKAVLFKKFADIDAFPICLKTQDVDEIVNSVKLLEPVFGGINLEDISAPRCFEIEKRLKKEMDIPVFHDDQHGTAIVVLAALINASKLVGKNIEDLKIVVSGAGAAGIAITKLLTCLGIDRNICQPVKEIILCDSKGIVYEGREELNSYKEELSRITNNKKKKGTLKDAMKGADAFIGVSRGNIVTKDMIGSMAKDQIVFAMANPVPEIPAKDAVEAGAKVVSTGRSDFPNQINNVLAFPGVFKGALSVRAKEINDVMKIAAAHAISDAVSEEELEKGTIIPDPFNKKVVSAVSKAVAETAIETKVAKT